MEWGQYRCEGKEWNGDNTGVRGHGVEWGQYMCEGMGTIQEGGVEWNGDNTGVRGWSGMGTIQK